MANIRRVKSGWRVEADEPVRLQHGTTEGVYLNWSPVSFWFYYAGGTIPAGEMQLPADPDFLRALSKTFKEAARACENRTPRSKPHIKGVTYARKS